MNRNIQAGIAVPLRRKIIGKSRPASQAKAEAVLNVEDLLEAALLLGIALREKAHTILQAGGQPIVPAGEYSAP